MKTLNFILYIYLLFNLVYCDYMNYNEDKTNKSIYSQDRYRARIVGGNQTISMERGYRVLLVIPIKANIIRKCGGTIIGIKWVLTAAHCHQSTIIRVHPLPIMRWHYIEAKKKYVFPRPKGFKSYFDYMLLELEHNLIYEDLIYQIELAYSQLEIIPGKIGKAAGWGPTTLKGPSSKILMEIDLPIIKQDQCKKLNKKMNVNEFCIGSGDESKAITTGDSGGGFVVDGKLLGVIANGNRRYTFIASVPYIRSWICEVTGI